MKFRKDAIQNKSPSSWKKSVLQALPFGAAFLVMGLALLLVVQATFNMLVAVGIAPVTGQPLPLISKGGTSTIINCAYVGVILSVSRSAKKREPKMAVKEI